jgi:hypothetical protein
MLSAQPFVTQSGPHAKRRAESTKRTTLLQAGLFRLLCFGVHPALDVLHVFGSAFELLAVVLELSADVRVETNEVIDGGACACAVCAILPRWTTSTLRTNEVGGIRVCD